MSVSNSQKTCVYTLYDDIYKIIQNCKVVIEDGFKHDLHDQKETHRMESPLERVGPKPIRLLTWSRGRRSDEGCLMKEVERGVCSTRHKMMKHSPPILCLIM